MDLCEMRHALEKLWLEEKWTMNQLADAIGTHRLTIAGILTGRRIPKERTMALIENFLLSRKS